MSAESTTRRTSDLIEVIVNGSTRSLAKGSTVVDLIESLGMNPAMIVVEHNLEILERGGYDAVVLSAGDRVELVHFVGGG